MGKSYNAIDNGTEPMRNITCLYFNARSIVSKLDSLFCIVETLKLDVIGIKESWLNDGLCPISPNPVSSNPISPKTRVIYLFPKKEMPMTSN